MALNKSDKEYFKLVVSEVVSGEVKPIRDMALSHQQTLHGTEENPGGIVKEIASFSSFKKQVVATVAVLQAVGGAIITYIGLKHNS